MKPLSEVYAPVWQNIVGERLSDKEPTVQKVGFQRSQIRINYVRAQTIKLNNAVRVIKKR